MCMHQEGNLSTCPMFILRTFRDSISRPTVYRLCYEKVLHTEEWNIQDEMKLVKTYLRFNSLEKREKGGGEEEERWRQG